MMPRTRTAVTALGVVALLGLTACNGTDGPLQGGTSPAPSGSASSSSPTSASATPTPTATKPAAAPDSDEVAKEQAFAKVKEYWALSDQILLRDLGKNPGRINSVAMGQAVDQTMKYAKAYASATDTAKGSRSVELWGGYTSQSTVDGKNYPHGYADLQVCSDVSKVQWFDAKGNPNPAPQMKRTVFNVGVVYNPRDGKWYVNKDERVEPVKAC